MTHWIPFSSQGTMSQLLWELAHRSPLHPRIFSDWMGRCLSLEVRSLFSPEEEEANNQLTGGIKGQIPCFKVVQLMPQSSLQIYSSPQVLAAFLIRPSISHSAPLTPFSLRAFHQQITHRKIPILALLRRILTEHNNHENSIAKLTNYEGWWANWKA